MGTEVDLGIEGLSDYREIGRGGFAVVYSALQVAFDRRVAVKVLDAVDDAGVRRFSREQLSMGSVDQHPNIVTPFNSGFTQAGGKPYLVMEYLSGGSLQHRLDVDGPFELHEAIDVIVPIAEALGHSHSSGVLHKDVKPANILVSSTGVVKLSDFGIAAIRESTATSAMAFSAPYTAPETFGTPDPAAPGQEHSGDPRDERSDLYSLAATLYALIVGRTPFDSETNNTPAGYMARILTQPVTPIGLPTLDMFLVSALAKIPGDRPATAAQFITELNSIRSASSDTVVAAQPPTDPGQSPTVLAPLRSPDNPVLNEQHPLMDGATLVDTVPPSAGRPWSPTGAPVEVPPVSMKKKRRDKELEAFLARDYLRSSPVVGDPRDALLSAAYALHWPYSGLDGYLDIWLAEQPPNKPDRRTRTCFKHPTVVLGLFYDPRRGAPYYLRYDHLDIGAATKLEPHREWRQEIRSRTVATGGKVTDIQLGLVTPTNSINEAVGLFERLETACGRGGLPKVRTIRVNGMSWDEDILGEGTWSAAEHWEATLGSGEVIEPLLGTDRWIAIGSQDGSGSDFMGNYAPWSGNRSTG
ncbi:MAG: protein kinase [bacterium]|nr:protein kinase [bacterium]